MPTINRGSHFILTKVVMITASQNQLTEVGTVKMSTTVNTEGVVLTQTPWLIY